MAEECYFFLMASMRKMRMNIPLTYTLEFFQNLFKENVIDKGASDAMMILLLILHNQPNSRSEKPKFPFISKLKKSMMLALQRDRTGSD